MAAASCVILTLWNIHYNGNADLLGGAGSVAGGGNPEVDDGAGGLGGGVVWNGCRDSGARSTVNVLGA